MVMVHHEHLRRVIEHLLLNRCNLEFSGHLRVLMRNLTGASASLIGLGLLFKHHLLLELHSILSFLFLGFSFLVFFVNLKF